MSLGCAQLLFGYFRCVRCAGVVVMVGAWVRGLRNGYGFVACLQSFRLTRIRRDVLVGTFASDSYVSCRR